MESKIESGNCLGWAARDASGVLSPYKFNRREIMTDDLSVKIMHCGVCYADFLSTKNKIGHSIYPLVPGHEIVGVVKDAGTNVKRFKVGDYVGVGTYVDSCRDCEYCNESREIYCDKTVFTFNRVDKDGTITKGGYSSHIVVHERYCYKIPDGYPLEKAAPLLCAGITVYSPMIKHNMNQPGKSLGIIGLGGLGHMAVKFGKAFGLKVTVISTSKSKKEEAIDLLLADRFLLSTDEKQMEIPKSPGLALGYQPSNIMSAAKSLDFIIDTASGDHPFDPYLSLLKVDGVMVLVGFPSEIKIQPINLNFGSRCIAGSLAGGTKETEEMLEFCAKNSVYPEVEMISIEYINEALERLEKREVRYRFVIDIFNSLNESK